MLLAGLPFGFLLEQVMSKGPLIKFDTSAANHLHEWVREFPALVAVLKVVTFLGTPLWFYILVGGAVGWLWFKSRRRLAVYLAATTLGGGVIDSIVKLSVNRPRPSLEDPIASAFGKSFPSGHAMISMVAYGALLLVFFPVVSRRWRIVAVVCAAFLVLAIGFSRLALGVHYITDVAGGYVLGAAWLSAATAAFRIWREERGRKRVRPLEGLEPEAASQLKP